MYKMQLQENQEQHIETSQPTNAYDENQVDEIMQIGQNQELMSKKNKQIFFIICIISVIAGTITGYGAFKLKNKKAEPVEVQNITINANQVKDGDVFGVQDKSTFADNATGYLEKGGVEGEGSHKLLREGGKTQTVALTSSVVDLDKLIGMQVKLYGETHKAEKAGWFMDVGRVEVISTEAEAPIQTLE